MSNDRFDVLDRLAPLFEDAEPAFEAFLRRRDRKRRNQRITAGVVAIAVFVAAVWIVTTAGSADRSQPATSGGTGPSVNVPDAPGVDYLVDLGTGTASPLPLAIVRTLGRDETGPEWRSIGHYALSTDGSTLAYVGLGEEGTPQIFTAQIDGSRMRQVTHDPIGATSPAWSPDGTSIAYVRTGPPLSGRLFVLDIATRTPTNLGVDGSDPQFAPAGASILYTGGTGVRPTLFTVPVTGGNGTVLIEPGPGLDDAGNGSLSPDGTLVTYLGSGSPLAPDGSPLTFHGEEVEHAGPGRFVSKLDGTGFGLLPGHVSNPAGTWSPDGTRIVCSGDDGVSGSGVIVVDVATGNFTHVAEGRVAIWLDNHTLLVEV
jgi:Tol biopolymer transport system component